jgi:single-strand DNA-binding protein
MNHITISGRLTRDPEARVSANGKSVTNFAVAVDRPFTKDTTDFFDVVTFGKLAEICGNNLDKGRRVIVDGVATMNRYTAKDGSKRSRFEVVANSVEFMDYRQNNGGGAGGFDSFGSAEQEEIDF